MGQRTYAQRATVAALLLVAAILATGGRVADATPADTISSSVGTGVTGSCCDSGPGAIADINHPRGFATMPDSSVLIVEAFGHRVRRVAPDGTITTVAGSGVAGYGGDGGLATNAQLRLPHAVVALTDGGFLIDDTNNFRIRRVWPNGTITTVAGTGRKGFSGDGGPATQARISAARGIDGTPDGTFYIADTDNNRIRRVDVNGTITTVAGTGTRGFFGDGGPATLARTNRPYGVAVIAGGGFLITDTFNNRVRRVGADGVITTSAGTGAAGFTGDGGPATATRLNIPHNSTSLPDGSILVADTYNNRVRKVAPEGTITTFAGTGTYGFSGEGGGPTGAQLAFPKATLAVASGVLVADAENDRVRYVGAGTWPAPPPGAGTVVIDGNTAFSGQTVSVAVPAVGAALVRLSNSSATEDGMLTNGITYSYTSPISWDLTDPAAGGTAGGGRRVVYAQWADASEAWSPVVADSVVIDTTAPQSTSPLPSLAVGTTLGSSTLPVTLNWTATDDASGVESMSLEQSRGGGAFTPIAVSPSDAQTATLQLTPGTAYAFRVQATDAAGNVGSLATGPTFSLGEVQDGDPAVTYAGAWTPEAVSSASGGTFTSTTELGASATLSFTGSAVAWVAPRARDRSLSQVYIDGVLVATVDKYGPSYQARRVDFVQTWSGSGVHTIQIRNLSTSGRSQADVDSFVILG